MNIFIFHRDLRLIDNTSLIDQIISMGNVIPIFIFPPEQIDQKKNEYFSNNSVQFMIESLHELSNEIKSHNGKLYFFKGDTLAIIKALHKNKKITSIGFNFDYTPYARKRDQEIITWGKSNGIHFHIKEDYVLNDILEGKTKNQTSKKPYLVFTAFKKYCMKNLQIRNVNKYKDFKFAKEKSIEKEKTYIDEKEISSFYIINDKINVHGGRSNGLKILEKIGTFKNYSEKRDLLTYKTTFLSAHNHFSTVSIREVYHKMVSKLGIDHGLINELYWRDFYVNISYYFPEVLSGQITSHNKSLKAEYDKISWKTNNNYFKAWCSGKTGFPIIDSGIRQLLSTGYMHNRQRMITSSFLCKDLHIDWREGEKFFAQKLVDYSAMQNNGGWQWSAGTGTDAQPYFRIFNPWTQGLKFDKDAEYIKLWLPELKNVPAKDIHNWFKPEIHEKYLKDGIKYYKPIIDHDEQRKKTLNMYKKALN